MERRWAGIALLLLFLLAACNGQPTPLTGDVDLSDPEVGGSAGIVLPGETPGPLPDLTREVAPRTTVLPFAVTATPEPSPMLVPSPTLIPSPTLTEQVEASAEPPEGQPVDDAEQQPAAESTATAIAERPTVHIVVAGETLYRIGELYGISYIDLAEYNGIVNFDQIDVGQELRIPPAEDATPEPDEGATATSTASPIATSEASPAATIAPEAEATIAATPSAGLTHTVRAGENLYRISQQYEISWVLVAEANGLISPNQITVGQVLKIPTEAPGPDPQFTHQVRAGETLFRIALQYGVPLSALVEANSLQAPYVIYPGQVLRIPNDE